MLLVELEERLARFRSALDKGLECSQHPRRTAKLLSLRRVRPKRSHMERTRLKSQYEESNRSESCLDPAFAPQKLPLRSGLNLRPQMKMVAAPLCSPSNSSAHEVICSVEGLPGMSFDAVSKPSFWNSAKDTLRWPTVTTDSASPPGM